VGADERLAGPIDPIFAVLKAAAGAAGARAFVVGGYVRDRLLGLRQPDIDVVVEGDALKLAEEFAGRAGAPAPVVFERFGTAQVRSGDRLLEFASTRLESYAPDSRKPAVSPASLEEDLRRRDFTVNALLMDFDGRVLDPLGTGLDDLEGRLLRTPDDPVRTFADDPLRMLRGVRLAAQLDFQLHPSLLPAMRQLRDRARPPKLSVERATDELRKLLAGPRPRTALELLDQAGLLEILLPDVVAGKGVEQRGYHTHDVFGHTLLTVEKTPGDLITRLAALLHDVGKPKTAAPDGSFLGHEKVGAEIAREALQGLRFSNEEVDRVVHLVRLHLRPVYYESDWSDGAVRKLIRDAGPDLDRLLDLARADIAASAYDRPEKIDELGERIRRLAAEQPSRFRIPVSGEDVMRELALAPGPAVGRVKRRLDDLVLEGTLAPERDVLLEYLRQHPELAE
jgi:putative nucleotidyltransferase with HDIG domain